MFTEPKDTPVLVNINDLAITPEDPRKKEEE
jgi:hypothetical protein